VVVGDGGLRGLEGLSCTDLERFVGIEGYYTVSPGIGGIVKERPEDFIVWEVLDGGLDSRLMWELGPLPHEPSRYSLWILCKTNKDMLGGLAAISRAIDMRLRKVKICGIKDRRATTYQFIALPTEAIPQTTRTIVAGPVEARHVGYVNELKTEDLVENRFEVVVRHVSGDPQSLSRFREEVQSEGVPNYFGPQRFGSLRPITHLVGRRIVAGEFREAVETFLFLHTDFEPEPVKMARQLAAEQSIPDQLLSILPRSLVYERAVARHLAERRGDYLGALRRLPLRLRRLFVEAYSSYIFNRALSLSLRDGARLNEPLVGDLAVRLDMYQRPYGRVIPVDTWNIEEVARRVARGEAAISLPHVGYLVWLPRGPRGDALRAVLEEEGVTTSSFRIRAAPELSTRGSPRPILLRPRELQLSVQGEGLVRLSFFLPPSGYATSLLRELMKRRCGLAYVGVRHCYA
jgi:tRNA pseudouridine13 synthase